MKQVTEVKQEGCLNYEFLKEAGFTHEEIVEYGLGADYATYMAKCMLSMGYTAQSLFNCGFPMTAMQRNSIEVHVSVSRGTYWI